MKKFVVFAAIAGISAMALSGCASQPALSKKDVKIEIASSATGDILIGDSVVISTSGKLLHQRTDKVRVTVESSADGNTWKPATSSKLKASKLAVELPLTLDAAGSTQYRAAVSTTGEKPKRLVTTEPISVDVLDVKQLIRSLYYDYTQAYAQGSASGSAFADAHNYPGVFDQANPSWAAGNAAAARDGLQSSLVPDLASITADPTWTVSAGKCNAAGTEPPKGRTFSVSVDERDTYTSYLPFTGKAVVHVTILDGAAYFYTDACGYVS